MNEDFNISIEDELKSNSSQIHVRIQQRNRKKCIITIEGLMDIEGMEPKNLEKISKDFRKTFNCSSVIKEGNVIQLQGDHREKIKDYLLKNNICRKEDIKIHGY